jgi:hypothetical protein
LAGTPAGNEPIVIALLALGIISSYPSMAGKATISKLAMVILFHAIRIPAIFAAH